MLLTRCGSRVEAATGRCEDAKHKDDAGWRESGPESEGIRLSACRCDSLRAGLLPHLPVCWCGVDDSKYQSTQVPRYRRVCLCHPLLRRDFLWPKAQNTMADSPYPSINTRFAASNASQVLYCLKCHKPAIQIPGYAFSLLCFLYIK